MMTASESDRQQVILDTMTLPVAKPVDEARVSRVAAELGLERVLDQEATKNSECRMSPFLSWRGFRNSNSEIGV
jgi:hypothetical protein